MSFCFLDILQWVFVRIFVYHWSMDRINMDGLKGLVHTLWEIFLMLCHLWKMNKFLTWKNPWCHNDLFTTLFTCTHIYPLKLPLIKIVLETSLYSFLLLFSLFMFLKDFSYSNCSKLEYSFFVSKMNNERKGKFMVIH